MQIVNRIRAFASNQISVDRNRVKRLRLNCALGLNRILSIMHYDETSQLNLIHRCWKIFCYNLNRTFIPKSLIPIKFSDVLTLFRKSPFHRSGLSRGVARNFSWVGINGSRRQNHHIKKFKVDWFGGYIYRYTPVATPLGLSTASWALRMHAMAGINFVKLTAKTCFYNWR